MSRIGKKPVQIPAGVKITVTARIVRVEGPKGQLSLELPRSIDAAVAEQQLVVSRSDDGLKSHALHGLTRTLLGNLVLGVTQGFKKQLEIEGLGYRAQVQGKTLNLQCGFSHPVLFAIPDGITIETPKPTQVVVNGIDKQLVGQVAADIRSIAPPEPYKGKGIRYLGEVIRRKAGKAAAATK